MKKIALLGSTGSIGRQTLDVVSQYPERFSLVALSAGFNVPLIIEQANRFQPRIVAVGNQEVAEQVKGCIPATIQVVYGRSGLLKVATHIDADIVLTAVVGSMGIQPTLAAIEAGKTIALANKETLVSAGQMVMKKAEEKQVGILPVDSEHSAIFQCLQGESRKELAEIILTASGGSFRHLSRAELASVTKEQALQHPNWSMGAKITIDSATMMNKGLEVIEAHWLFQVPYEQVKVILHEESIIHSMVAFKDSAVLAQLGNPDMRVPIQYALSYPERLPLATEPLDLEKLASLHFRKLDWERYPCLKMAYDAGKIGGTMPTVLNAANEVAVASFLEEQISFLQIEEIIYRTLEKHHAMEANSIEVIEEVDRWARSTATALLEIVAN